MTDLQSFIDIPIEELHVHSLNIKDFEIDFKHYQKITSLIISQSSISSFKGIELLENLLNLSIYYSTLEDSCDFQVLNLSKLRYLRITRDTKIKGKCDLSNNQLINDIYISSQDKFFINISSMSSLQVLNLSGYYKLSCTTSLNNLRNLYLVTPIKNRKLVLSKFPNLTTLCVNKNINIPYNINAYKLISFDSGRGYRSNFFHYKKRVKLMIRKFIKRNLKLIISYFWNIFFYKSRDISGANRLCYYNYLHT